MTFKVQHLFRSAIIKDYWWQEHLPPWKNLEDQLHGPLPLYLLMCFLFLHSCVFHALCPVHSQGLALSLPNPQTNLHHHEGPPSRSRGEESFTFANTLLTSQKFGYRRWHSRATNWSFTTYLVCHLQAWCVTALERFQGFYANLFTVPTPKGHIQSWMSNLWISSLKPRNSTSKLDLSLPAFTRETFQLLWTLSEPLSCTSAFSTSLLHTGCSPKVLAPFYHLLGCMLFVGEFSFLDQHSDVLGNFTASTPLDHPAVDDHPSFIKWGNTVRVEYINHWEDQKSAHGKRGRLNLILGKISHSRFVCHVHSRCRQLVGRLDQVTTGLEVFQDLCHRWTLDAVLLQVCFYVLGSSSRKSRCSGGSVGSVHSDLCVSFLENFLSASQDWDKGHSNDPHCSGMAQADVICWPGKTSGRCSVGSSRLSRSFILPSCFTVPGFNMMAIKA